MGHIIGENGIQPDSDKVDKVKNFPRPKNVSELCGFIGLASYYRRFIKDFAIITAPLHKLFKKDTIYQWNPACQEAFDTLKQKLITAPILIYPDFEKEFILFTDASYSGLGAVLAQLDADGKEHVVAYASRGLLGSEQRYSATEIECLAIIWAVKYFHPYLYDKYFQLITDYSALRGILERSQPTGRVARWTLLLQSYQFSVTHRPGKVNSNVDTLSRILQQKLSDIVNNDDF